MFYSAINRVRCFFLAALVLAGATGSSAQLRIPATLTDRIPPPTCRLTRTDDSQAVAFERVSLPLTRRPITHVRTVVAGDRLRIEGAADDPGPYLVTVRVKSSEDSRLAPQTCKDFTWSPKKGALEALDGRRLPGSIWQVEISAGPKSAGRPISFLRRTSSAIKEDSTAALFGLACHDWNPAGPTKHQDRGFANRVRLDVDPPPIDSSIDQPRRAAVAASILNAAALWMSACRECLPEHLSVIMVDGELHVRSALARWLEKLPAQVDVAPIKMEGDLKSHLESYTFLRAGEVAEMPSVKPVEAYVTATPLRQSVDILCAWSIDASVARTLKRVQNALCRPDTLERSARARIKLRLQSNGVTYCGTDPDIVACRADNVLTELNVRDFRFRTLGDIADIGSGTIELDLLPVLVHEVGHWIGLQHLDRGTSIMASNAEQARCIDEPTIAALLAGLDAGPMRPQAFRLHKPMRP